MRVSYVLDIASTQASLDIVESGAVWVGFAHQVGDERLHPCGIEEDGLVMAVWDE